MSRIRSRFARSPVFVVAVVVVVAALWWSLGGPAGDGSPTARPGATSSSAARPGASSPAPSPTTAPSGLPAIARDDLPLEALDTLDLIADGGPFPYDRDGAVFQNRERLLPAQARGWYHEYTVPTPGEDDRGARRIVTGRDGAAYWTPDHYETFSVIEEDP